MFVILRRHVRDGPAVDPKGALMAWIYLFIAGLLEIGWVYSMKLSFGFTRLWPSLATVGFMIGSFGLLALAIRVLPMGTAYMIWTGIGALGAFILGIALLGEPVTGLRVAAAALIFAGLILMKLSSSA